MDKCPICTNPAKISEHGILIIDCTNCGKFTLKNVETYEYEEELYKVSCWIREQNDGYEKAESNNYPKLNQDKFDEIVNTKNKAILEKFDLLMINLYKIDDSNSINNILMTRCWVKNENEFERLFEYAIDEGLIKGSISGLDIRNYSFFDITFLGSQYVESLDEPNKSSKKIFVAFNFEKSLIDVFDTSVRQAIEELGFIYTVVNQESSPHDKAISDEIIAKLKSCKILIADFTNHRNSVYFEAGFAMGMKIPIIWTCKQGHSKELAFDTRQYPHLVWKDGEDLKQQVMNRIKVII